MVSENDRRTSVRLGFLVIGVSLALGIWWLNGPEGDALRRRLRAQPPRTSVSREAKTSDVAASNRTLFDSITDGAREGVREAVHEQLGPTLHGLGSAIEDTLRAQGKQLNQALEPLRSEPLPPDLDEERRRQEEEKRQW